MPITVFGTKGIQGNRRARIQAGEIAGGTHTSEPYEAWIAANQFCGGFKVFITGPQGFQRGAVFAVDDTLAVINERIPGSDARKLSSSTNNLLEWVLPPLVICAVEAHPVTLCTDHNAELMA